MCSAPTALGNLRPDLPQHLSSLLTTLFSSSSLPPSFLAQLVVLPRSKSWTLTISLLILSSSGGNVLDLALMAARAALASTRLPATRPIGLGDDGPGGEIAGKDQGFSGLVKGGKAGVNAVDFELLDGGWDEGERLERWEDLPVGLTLNLVRPSLLLRTMKEMLTCNYQRSTNCPTSTRPRSKSPPPRPSSSCASRVKETFAVSSKSEKARLRWPG